MSATLYIMKNNLKNNVEYIRNILSKETSIIAMVKANAYGCGILEITKYLETLNIKDFGVALVKEGVFLRKNNILSNILVTSQFLEEDIDDIISYDLSVSASNLDTLKILNLKALEKNKKVKIHIKIDTGMGRLGFTQENILNNLNFIKNNFTNIIIDGIFTHLSCADSDENYTLMQLEQFNDVVNLLKSNNFNFKYIHALNSYGILKYNKYQFTHVRPGMLLYGYLDISSDFLPILELKAPIIRIQEIKKETKISYNGTYIAPKNSKIATIQIGYADGVPRSLANKYYIYVGNSKAKIVGNVCMDMCMIDITNLKENLNVGDFVSIFKTNEDIQKISNLSNTISYEIISKLSDRINRKLI